MFNQHFTEKNKDFKMRERGRGMAQCLTAYTALPEDLDSIPITYLTAHNCL